MIGDAVYGGNGSAGGVAHGRKRVEVDGDGGGESGRWSERQDDKGEGRKNERTEKGGRGDHGFGGVRLWFG